MTSTLAFSSRTVPWLFYGATALDGAVDYDEALHRADLDFTAELRPTAYKNAKGNWTVQKGRSAVVRTDTDAAVGQVSSSYALTQYSDAFAIMKDMNPEIVAAGSHNGGRQAFMVVQDPQCRSLKGANGQDGHELYAVMRTSLDASRGHELALLALRDKCMNMMPLSFGLRGAEQRWSIRHSGRAEERLNEVSHILKGLRTYAEEYDALATRLADIDLEIEEARTVLDAIIPDAKSHDKRVEEILGTYTNSDTNGFTGTGWGLVNAVTEFYDHREGGKSQNGAARFLRGLDGPTRQMTNRVVRELVKR
jgi:phage/plasmid-like protein (TIGR03299 family)